jgi:hypothetical protein
MGKFGAAFLIVSSFAAFFAPIVFLLNAQSVLNPDLPAFALIALFSEPARILVIADYVAILGVVLLAAALAQVLIALTLRGKPRPLVPLLFGGVALLCLTLWVPVMLSSQNQARGAITTVDAATATGGYSIASILLLVAGLAYMAFTIRIEHGVKHRRLTSLWWPAYGAVNVLGSVAIAGFFAGSLSGVGSTDALSLGLALKMTLVPMLGVMAYGDLKDRFPVWRDVHLIEQTRVWDPAVAAANVPEPAPWEALDPLASQSSDPDMVIPGGPR